MIPRYEFPEISQIWSDQYKFESFLKIELELLKALEEENIIPNGIAEKTKKVLINPKRIEEIEVTTRHDVIAFCTSITEQLPTEIGKFFHYGVTSSDIIDSALTLQLKSSLDVTIKSLEQFLETLKSRSIETKQVMTFGRSHGMYAEPMSFGQKLLGHYAEFKRRLNDLKDYSKNELTIQISGAVGNYTILPPSIESKVARNLGFKVEEASTQVIPRDRLAKLISITSLLANAIERLAIEIRHLHTSDVAEVAEGFRKGQKGSSTMPHKKNPISTENLTGIARIIRSHLNVSFENCLLWHERDISHSSAERLYLPDHFGLINYALNRFSKTLTELDIDVEVIENKILSRTHYLSSFYLHFLIKNCSEIKREDIYSIVQNAALNNKGVLTPTIFREKIQIEINQLGQNISLPPVDADGLRKIYLNSVDEVFRRVLD